MMYRFVFCLGVMVFPQLAMADESTPLLYSRTHIIITHKAAEGQKPQQKPLPWAPGDGLVFDVEVRDATSMYNQSGWFNLSSQSEKSGVLLAFSAPSMAPIIASAQYKPLDILLVDKEGTIRQIVPNLMLSELEQDIYPANPVLAFLFLKGGTCETLRINPGDVIDYKLFKKPPVVLSAPGKPAATTREVRPQLPSQ